MWVGRAAVHPACRPRLLLAWRLMLLLNIERPIVMCMLQRIPEIPSTGLLSKYKIRRERPTTWCSNLE